MSTFISLIINVTFERNDETHWCNNWLTNLFTSLFSRGHSQTNPNMDTGSSPIPLSLFTACDDRELCVFVICVILIPPEPCRHIKCVLCLTCQTCRPAGCLLKMIDGSLQYDRSGNLPERWTTVTLAVIPSFIPDFPAQTLRCPRLLCPQFCQLKHTCS